MDIKAVTKLKKTINLSKKIAFIDDCHIHHDRHVCLYHDHDHHPHLDDHHIIFQ